MLNLNIQRAADVTPAFTKTQGENGVLYVRTADNLKNRLSEELSFFGYVAKDENAYIAHCGAVISSLLNPSDQAFLRGIGNGLVGEGVVIIDNLPFEAVQFSPLPGEPARTAKKTSLSEHLLLGFSQFLGPAYGVANEGQRLINDLIPSQGDLEKFTGNGSRKTLGIHTENAALRFAAPGRDLSPKYLLLTGVSYQSFGGPTTPVAIAARAVSRISPKSRNVLRDLSVNLGLPVRQRRGHPAQDEVGPVPLIIGASGQEEVIAAFYGDMIRPISNEAAQAVEELETAFNEVSVHLEVLPGTMVYIANGRALHGRSTFEPRFDENGRAQRWLQRIFGTGRLDAFAEYPRISDRVFDITL